MENSRFLMACVHSSLTPSTFQDKINKLMGTWHPQ